jgi:hypothetical protein
VHFSGSSLPFSVRDPPFRSFRTSELVLPLWVWGAVIQSSSSTLRVQLILSSTILFVWAWDEFIAFSPANLGISFRWASTRRDESVVFPNVCSQIGNIQGSCLHYVVNDIEKEIALYRSILL